MPDTIFWYTKEPVTSARIMKTDEPLTKAQKDKKLPGFQKGDRVALIYVHGEVTASEEIKDGTVWGAMTAIERGLKRKVPKNCPTLHQMIGLFLREKDRRQLLKKHEEGMLKFKDLSGDYQFFSTPFTKEGNMWVYTLGS